jgi:hypothetical protein
MIDLLVIGLLVSFVGNGFLLYRYFKLKQTIKDRAPSLELDEFVADLLNGAGVVKISRVNPHDIFLRSPRARR